MTPRNYGLMRVFWPSDGPRDDIPGVLVGWRNSDLDVLVVSILLGVEVRNAIRDSQPYAPADRIAGPQR